MLFEESACNDFYFHKRFLLSIAITEVYKYGTELNRLITKGKREYVNSKITQIILHDSSAGVEIPCDHLFC